MTDEEIRSTTFLVRVYKTKHTAKDKVTRNLIEFTTRIEGKCVEELSGKYCRESDNSRNVGETIISYQVSFKFKGRTHTMWLEHKRAEKLLIDGEYYVCLFLHKAPPKDFFRRKLLGASNAVERPMTILENDVLEIAATMDKYVNHPSLISEVIKRYPPMEKLHAKSDWKLIVSTIIDEVLRENIGKEQSF
jgi:hypothetical protein